MIRHQQLCLQAAAGVLLGADAVGLLSDIHGGTFVVLFRVQGCLVRLFHVATHSGSQLVSLHVWKYIAGDPSHPFSSQGGWKQSHEISK